MAFFSLLQIRDNDFSKSEKNPLTEIFSVRQPEKTALKRSIAVRQHSKRTPLQARKPNG
jgi:hypothetical protein